MRNNPSTELISWKGRDVAEEPYLGGKWRSQRARRMRKSMLASPRRSPRAPTGPHPRRRGEVRHDCDAYDCRRIGDGYEP
jgi:hypothetical protein